MPNVDTQILDHQAALLEAELRADRARRSAESTTRVVAKAKAALKELGGKPLDLVEIAGDLDDAEGAAARVRSRATTLRGEARRLDAAA